MPAPSETYPSAVHDIYPGIAPDRFQGINKGKVVFITGGSKGIGLATARAFIQSGASVFISARSAGTVESAAKELSALGGDVGYAVADVTKEEDVKSAVDTAIKRFGQIDIVIANAGVGYTPDKLGEIPAQNWWDVLEASLKGSFLTAHATIPHLVKTKGYIIFASSVLGQTRLPGGSSYNLAKHSMNRLAEWVEIDYGSEGVKSFAIHPGAVKTDVSLTLINSGVPESVFSDSPELAAWSQVRLTSGSEDWLSGRFLSTNWDLDELGKLKEAIVEQDALKNRLALPIV
ncbi:hypothetical protein FRC02_009119 [Tulasnella sp. 418]|nr:hypothetical protein FRC02_009119 [Tulasnella sp. 418]